MIILYGTETGNAEMVAEDLADAIGATDVINLAGFEPAKMDHNTQYFCVCSTYGEGEVPASAKAFAEALKQGCRLDRVPFAVFGLGDRSYEHFAGGATTLRGLLLASGGVEMAPMGVHDANGPDLPEDAAIAWAQALLSDIAAA